MPRRPRRGTSAVGQRIQSSAALQALAQHWRAGELEWIVRNGIKMTGMPAWRDTMSDAEISQVAAFLEAMPKMQPQLYLRWRQARICTR